ncbi:MAG: PadR family transcriptional regulator [Erysipelotrichaceae bacterium]|nr:PadR family transcriptional regulator [Erysipelotrichaceae bacterium]
MNPQFKKGVLDLIVMMIVEQNDVYGYELVKQVCEIIPVKEGTIYPLLKRMTHDHLFITYLKESTEGPPRKYYHITDKGKLVLNQLKEDWLMLSHKINHYIKGETTYENQSSTR